MPRRREPHLHPEKTRHGAKSWYVRIGHGPRFRVRGSYGTPEFHERYLTALAAARFCAAPQTADTRGTKAGTLAWLVERYRETSDWQGLSLATRRQRENIFRSVLETAGEQPAAKIATAHIVAGRDRRANTPAQARNFLDAMRGLFRWAHQAQLVKTDPTAGVKNPARKRGDGFTPWTEEHVAAYEARWPLGTRQRVWLDVLLYTGLRRGDAVRLGRQHVREGVAAIKTEKSGETVAVTLPILPVLQATLDAGPTGDLTFICGARGQPLTKESFGNAFKKACHAAGVPGSAHGVRKIAATRAADAGATAHELMSIFGWLSVSQAELYTRRADRNRLARAAMGKLAPENAGGTSIPAPCHPVREKSGKKQ